MNAFSRDIALNYGPEGIRRNTILPGLMNTPLIHMDNVTEVYGSTEEMVRQRDAFVPLGHMGDGWAYGRLLGYGACCGASGLQ